MACAVATEWGMDMSSYEEGAIPDIAPVDESLHSVDESGASFSPERWPKWMEAGRQKGPDHLTPTQRRILAFIVEHQAGEGAVALTKREIAAHLKKSEKTVDRLIADLRHRKLVDSAPRFTSAGGQVANAYKVTAAVRKKYPVLFE